MSPHGTDMLDSWWMWAWSWCLGARCLGSYFWWPPLGPRPARLSSVPWLTMVGSVTVPPIPAMPVCLHAESHFLEVLRRVSKLRVSTRPWPPASPTPAVEVGGGPPLPRTRWPLSTPPQCPLICRVQPGVGARGRLGHQCWHHLWFLTCAASYLCHLESGEECQAGLLSQLKRTEQWPGTVDSVASEAGPRSLCEGSGVMVVRDHLHRVESTRQTLGMCCSHAATP